MLNKIKPEDRKIYYKYALIQIPLGIIIAIILVVISNKFIGCDFNTGHMILFILVVIFSVIYSLWNFYNKLIDKHLRSENTKKNK
jgi:hypothetical protein